MLDTFHISSLIKDLEIPIVTVVVRHCTSQEIMPHAWETTRTIGYQPARGEERKPTPKTQTSAMLCKILTIATWKIHGGSSATPTNHHCINSAVKCARTLTHYKMKTKKNLKLSCSFCEEAFESKNRENFEMSIFELKRSTSPSSIVHIYTFIQITYIT